MLADTPQPAEKNTPRVAPLPEAEWDAVLKAVVAATGPLNIFTTLARHQELFQSWIGFASMLLMKGTLPARVRELAILRTAHHRDCAYEWTHHHRIGLEAGLSEVEIAALRLDPADHAWSDDDSLVLLAADELQADGTLSDTTWNGLSANFGERELIELVMLIGHYNMVAFALNALRVQPEEEG